MEAAAIITGSRNGLDLVLDQLAAAGCQPIKKGSGWTAKCPAHADSTPSLRVSAGSKGQDVVASCFASCSFTDILDALGLRCDATRRDGTPCRAIVSENLRQCSFHDHDRDRSAARPIARASTRREPTPDELATGPAWDAWRSLGETYADAPRVRTEHGDARQLVDQARAWLVFLADEARRARDVDTLNRVLSALGADPDFNPVSAATQIEALARDLAASGNGPGLARALRSIRERHHDAKEHKR